MNNNTEWNVHVSGVYGTESCGGIKAANLGFFNAKIFGPKIALRRFIPDVRGVMRHRELTIASGIQRAKGERRMHLL